VRDRAEESAADHHPRLGIGVAVGRHRPEGLLLADPAGDVVVHGSHVAGDEAADLAILAGLRDPLHPQVRHQGLLPAGDRRRRGRRGARDQRSEDAVENRAVLLPRGVEAREPEVALRREVAVEHGLGDPRLAGDLGGRRARVAALGEDAQRRQDDLPAARVGG
jgi:hypothetical protein